MGEAVGESMLYSVSPIGALCGTDERRIVFLIQAQHRSPILIGLEFIIFHKHLIELFLSMYIHCRVYVGR